MKKKRQKNKKPRKQWVRTWLRRLKEKRKEFRQWQERPYEVAPMSEEQHECCTCHTVYTGNFCPRCGQSARIRRYSFIVAFLNFLDVWGLGNRGMFRTIRDLVLRPGYMIRDYLKGMQMAYFPPFKMFFLLTALSIMVTHGFNILGKTIGDEMEPVPQEIVVNSPEMLPEAETAPTDPNSEQVEVIIHKYYHFLEAFSEKVNHFQKRFPSLFALFGLMLLACPFYLFFRKCPNIPDLRFSEFFVALVYINNMYTLFTIVTDFFCLNDLDGLLLFSMLIPLKQLTGYRWWKVILYPLLASLLMLAALILCIFLSVLAIGVQA